MSERNTQIIKPGQNVILQAPDVIRRLEDMRNHHAGVIMVEMRKQEVDYNVVNEHEPKSQLAFDALSTIKRLMQQNSEMAEVLKNRVIVALHEAKQPEWKPTHRHYKGKLYRVTGTRFNADHEELTEEVEYDDVDGNKYTLSRRRWDSFLDSGKPRYEFIGLVKP